jgi:hypothetical protein
MFFIKCNDVYVMLSISSPAYSRKLLAGQQRAVTVFCIASDANAVIALTYTA